MSPADHLKFEALKVEGRLPLPKGAALHVIRLTQKEDVSNQEIAYAIKAAPTLSGRVLKIANAMVAYQVRPIASIADAVAVLGLNTIRQLVLGLSLIEEGSEGTCKGFDYQTFWARSLLTGITAQKLALRNNLGSPEEIFVLGLLMQIGQLGLATAHPQEYTQVLEKYNAEGGSLAELEQAAFGLDHNQLSKELLAEWGMPQVFQMIALFHEEPERSGLAQESRNWRLLNMLHLADYLAEVCLTTQSRQRKMISRLLLLATRLGVEAEALSELGDKVVKEWSCWGKLFGITIPTIPPFKELLVSVPLLPEMVEINAPSETSGLSSKLDILLVDDDHNMLVMMQTMLKHVGHSVRTANSGAEALKRMQESTPQVVITDWSMPEMDGISFCKALRSNPAWRNVYVFIVAAQENVDSLLHAYEAGVDDYLSKPVNFRMWAARLHAAQRVVLLQEELESDRKYLRQFADELAASNQRLQQLALTDVLTGLHNRRYANEYLERQWALAERNNQSLSCMIIDVDRFKQINDTYGHKVGDDALKQVADVLRNSIRRQDVVCRLGGEEFLLICPDTRAEQAYLYAERLRKSILNSAMQGIQDKEFHLTVSIGVASRTPELLNVEMLMQLADKRLYAAKKAGRNCTIAS